MLKKLKSNWLVILITVLILGLAGYLRFYQLSSLPPSPYWEEVALGYDAYSISQTLKDHHGHFFPLVAFESFGDWKPSGYFYVLVPFIKLLGLSIDAVRLPSALAGMMTVIGLSVLNWTLVKEGKLFITLKKHYSKNFKFLVILVSLFVGAVSSWAVMFSRAAWEANLATALLLWGVITFLWFKIEQSQSHKIQYVWLFLSPFLFTYSMYTYHAARVVAPILLGFLMLQFVYDSFKKNQRDLLFTFKRQKRLLLSLLTSGIFFTLLILPLILSLSSPQVNNRFATTSVFNNLQVIKTSNRLQAEANHSLSSRIIYHRDILFAREILNNFFKHFSLDFLFLHGDANRRHSTGFVGELYYLDLCFIVLAIYGLWRNQRRLGLFLLIWLVVSIIPSSLTLEGSPHALRILPSLPAWLLLVSLGVLFWFDWLVSRVNKIWFISLNFGLFLLYSFQVMAFWRFYTQVYSTLYADEWQYGYRQMVDGVRALKTQYPERTIYISRSQGRPAMYWWFYTQEDPSQVQAREHQETKSSLQNEFTTYRNITFFDKPEMVKSGSIAVFSPDELKKSGLIASFKQLKVVKDLQDEPVWLIGVVE